MPGPRPRTLGVAALLLLGLLLGFVMTLTMLVTTLAEDQDAADLPTSCTVTSVGNDEKTGVVAVPNGWGPLVDEAARQAGLPASLVAALLAQQSGWNANALGPVLKDGTRDQGMAQFDPATWAIYGNGGNPLDPGDAIAALGRHMAALKKEVQPIAGDDVDELVRLTLAAYNAGPDAVQEHNGVPPYPETQRYVEKILDGAQGNFSAGCKAPTGARGWDGDLGDGQWTTPLPGGVFTSGYGGRALAGVPSWANQHVGVDIATPGAGKGAGGVVLAPTGLRITGFNAADGCVVAKEDGPDPDFGFAFCHLNSWDVTKGQKLKRGDIIGVEGNQGRFGMVTHLHLEIYKPDAPDFVFPYQGHNIDPEPILKEKGAWPR